MQHIISVKGKTKEETQRKLDMAIANWEGLVVEAIIPPKEHPEKGYWLAGACLHT